MKVLIVIDAQNDFITGALANPAAEAVLPNIKNLIENAIGLNEPIIWTRDTHKDNYLETQEGKNLPIPHCIRNTEGWKIEQSVDYPLYSHSYYLNKESFGAKPIYWQERFHDIQRNYKAHIDEIHICGFVSSICVVSNAMILKALYPEAKIIFHADASAGLTPEDHAAACTVMKNCQIEVIE